MTQLPELWIIVLGFHLILIDFPSQFNTLENNYRKWNNRKLFVNLCYLQELFTLWSGSMTWKNDFITKFQKFTSLNGTLSHSIWKIVSYKNATKISSPRFFLQRSRRRYKRCVFFLALEYLHRTSFSWDTVLWLFKASSKQWHDNIWFKKDSDTSFSSPNKCLTWNFFR